MSSVEYLVLDEVDSLLELGFESQVHGVEEKLLNVRHKFYFSATIPPRIEKMASESLQDPLHISVGEVGVSPSLSLYLSVSLCLSLCLCLCVCICCACVCVHSSYATLYMYITKHWLYRQQSFDGNYHLPATKAGQ